MWKYRCIWNLISKSLRMMINFLSQWFPSIFILQWSISRNIRIEILIQIREMKSERPLSLYHSKKLRHFDVIVLFFNRYITYDVQIFRDHYVPLDTFNDKVILRVLVTVQLCNVGSHDVIIFCLLRYDIIKCRY